MLPSAIQAGYEGVDIEYEIHNPRLRVVYIFSAIIVFCITRMKHRSKLFIVYFPSFWKTENGKLIVKCKKNELLLMFISTLDERNIQIVFYWSSSLTSL